MRVGCECKHVVDTYDIVGSNVVERLLIYDSCKKKKKTKNIPITKLLTVRHGVYTDKRRSMCLVLY